MIKYQMFKSTYDLAKFLESTPVKWQRPDGHGDYLNARLIEKLKYGDSVLVGKLKCSVKTRGKKEVLIEDAYGKMPDVSKALMGDPYCFVATDEVDIENKYITIVYDQSVSCNYSSAKIIENGKRLLRALKYLEQNDYRVRLYGCTTGTGTNTNMMLCQLKDYGQPFCLTKIAFAIANPEWLRGVDFAWTDRSPVTEYQYGYGRPAYIDWNAQSLANGLSRELKCGVLMVSEKMVESNPRYSEEENDARFIKRLEEMSVKILKQGFTNQ